MTRTSRDTLVMNGINNHPHQRAELDFYATEPKQVRLLLGIEDLSGARILEPCCGTGSIAQVLTEAGLEVEASDIADRGFGRQQDFFTIPSFDGHIVTNPPFTRAVDFVSHALSIIPKGRKACFFLKLTFLEGIKRRHFFDTTPPSASTSAPAEPSAPPTAISHPSKAAPSPTHGSFGRKDSGASQHSTGTTLTHSNAPT